MVGESGKIPATWPKNLATKINVNNPMTFTLDGNQYRSFTGVSISKSTELSLNYAFLNPSDEKYQLQIALR